MALLLAMPITHHHPEFSLVTLCLSLCCLVSSNKGEESGRQLSLHFSLVSCRPLPRCASRVPAVTYNFLVQVALTAVSWGVVFVTSHASLAQVWFPTLQHMHQSVHQLRLGHAQLLSAQHSVLRRIAERVKAT